MVAAPPFADVVVEARHVQEFRLGYFLHAVTGDRKALFARAIAEPAHVADHHHRVRVHGVDVEEVVLHLPDYASELRKVARQHPVPAHPRQLRDQRVRRFEQIHEQRRVLRPGRFGNHRQSGPDAPGSGGWFARAPLRCPADWP